VKNKPADSFSQAIAALERGDVIVFPTETLYGLGADALNAAAVERVFVLKGRNPQNPIPILVADEEMLKRLVAEISPTARRLMKLFWPGPLTLVLPARNNLAGPLINRDGAVGVRISSHPLAARLVSSLGRPVTATSANPSGEMAARTAAQAFHYFSTKVEVFLDGGQLPSHKGSTVAEVTGDKVTIIREGDISASQLYSALKHTR
jgi:L-threonylcarbamoyladenylate synthase